MALGCFKRREAQANKHRADQLQTNINRDFSKATEILASLYDQKKLAALDVLESQEAAKLYYGSYKAGKNNLIDVQTANYQAFQAKVGAVQIDAQILNQLILLNALSGEQNTHESP